MCGELWLKGREAAFRDITHTMSDLYSHISKLWFLIPLEVSWPLITAGTPLSLSELLNLLKTEMPPYLHMILGNICGIWLKVRKNLAVFVSRCCFWAQFLFIWMKCSVVTYSSFALTELAFLHFFLMNWVDFKQGNQSLKWTICEKFLVLFGKWRAAPQKQSVSRVVYINYTYILLSCIVWKLYTLSFLTFLLCTWLSRSSVVTRSGNWALDCEQLRRHPANR